MIKSTEEGQLIGLGSFYTNANVDINDVSHEKM